MKDKVNLIVEDGMVVVDDVGRFVFQLSSLVPPGLHSVNVVDYDGAFNVTHCEWERVEGQPTKRDKVTKGQIRRAVQGWEDA